MSLLMVVGCNMVPTQMMRITIHVYLWKWQSWRLVLLFLFIRWRSYWLWYGYTLAPLKSYLLPLCSHLFWTWISYSFLVFPRFEYNVPNKYEICATTYKGPWPTRCTPFICGMYIWQSEIFCEQSLMIYIYTHVIANQLVQFIILVPEVDHSIAIIWATFT